ncbi:hypothetical protein LAZ67_4003898, partial [Cordylochernes scorpioides]
MDVGACNFAYKIVHYPVRFKDAHEGGRFREAVISYHHDIPTGGHFGVKKVMRRLKSDYYWPGMRTQVRNYIRRCESCQLSNQGVAKAASAPHFRPEKPFEHLALDFIGPLETTPRGYSSILTIVDLFTKFPILIPTKDQCANTVIRALLERIITTFGVPKTILSDRGSAFMSCVFKGVCKAMGVGAVNTSAWRPQSNGAVERLNRTVIESLRRCTVGNNWDTTLPMVALAIRTTVHASTGFTPAKLVFGHELRLPQPFQEEERLILYMAVFYERELVGEVERIREMVRQTYLNEQQEARVRFETRELRTFGTGDLVLVKRMHETKERHKFEPRYRGPYEVLQRTGDTVYLLKDLETGNLDKIRIDRIKAYHAPVKTYPVGDRNPQDKINDVINDEDHWTGRLREVMIRPESLQTFSSLEGTERYQVNFVLGGGFSCRCRKLSAQRQTSDNRSDIVVYDALSVAEMRVIQTGGWERSARWMLFYTLRSLEPILYGQNWNMWWNLGIDHFPISTYKDCSRENTDQPSTEGQRRGRLRDEELDVALGMYPEAHCRKVQRGICKVENSPTRKLNDALKAKAGEDTQLEMTMALSKYPEARCRKAQRR